MIETSYRKAVVAVEEAVSDMAIDVSAVSFRRTYGNGGFLNADFSDVCQSEQEVSVVADFVNAETPAKVVPGGGRTVWVAIE